MTDCCGGGECSERATARPMFAPLKQIRADLSPRPHAGISVVDRANSKSGNFLENMYEQIDAFAPHAVLVQAKAYFGGGEWDSLEIDYARVAQLLRKHSYRGYVSLEMEGKETSATAVPKSLALLRKAFGS